jgi:hypothetical protein
MHILYPPNQVCLEVFQGDAIVSPHRPLYPIPGWARTVRTRHRPPPDGRGGGPSPASSGE